jgi:hypothetical protein
MKSHHVTINRRIVELETVVDACHGRCLIHITPSTNIQSIINRGLLACLTPGQQQRRVWLARWGVFGWLAEHIACHQIVDPERLSLVVVWSSGLILKQGPIQGTLYSLHSIPRERLLAVYPLWSLSRRGEK